VLKHRKGALNQIEIICIWYRNATEPFYLKKVLAGLVK